MPDRIPPVAITACTVTSALGRGCDAHLEALTRRRGGLAANDFTSTALPCAIGRVAGLDGILVLLLGCLLLYDNALEHAPADVDFEIEKHRVERQGEGVDRLDVRALVVAVGLRDRDLGEQILQDR